jgi:hypothetical protein
MELKTECTMAIYSTGSRNIEQFHFTGFLSVSGGFLATIGSHYGDFINSGKVTKIHILTIKATLNTTVVWYLMTTI